MKSMSSLPHRQSCGETLDEPFRKCSGIKRREHVGSGPAPASGTLNMEQVPKPFSRKGYRTSLALSYALCWVSLVLLPRATTGRAAQPKEPDFAQDIAPIIFG